MRDNEYKIGQDPDIEYFGLNSELANAVLYPNDQL